MTSSPTLNREEVTIGPVLSMKPVPSAASRTAYFPDKEEVPDPRFRRSSLYDRGRVKTLVTSG